MVRRREEPIPLERLADQRAEGMREQVVAPIVLGGPPANPRKETPHEILRRCRPRRSERLTERANAGKQMTAAKTRLTQPIGLCNQSSQKRVQHALLQHEPDVLYLARTPTF